MPLSLPSLFLGFVLGVVATAIAWSLTQTTRRPQETAKVTAVWSLHDVTEPGQRPAIIAEHLDGVTLPTGSKVVVPTEGIHRVPANVLAACEVRMHPDVRMNAAIGKDRALLFSGHVSPKAHAVVTTEATAVRRLQNDFSRMWSEATPYVERAEIHELASKDGRHVDVTGRALEVLEYRGRKMLRLADSKASVGVVTTQEDVAKYSGGVIRVVGKFHRDGGHAYIEATKVTLVEAPARAVPA
jgi:hypothetical protein